MCLEVKFYYETLLKGEWRTKHIMEEKDYICWVTLHPQKSIRKWKEQREREYLFATAAVGQKGQCPSVLATRSEQQKIVKDNRKGMPSTCYKAGQWNRQKKRKKEPRTLPDVSMYSPSHISLNWGLITSRHYCRVILIIIGRSRIQEMTELILCDIQSHVTS